MSATQTIVAARQERPESTKSGPSMRSLMTRPPLTIGRLYGTEVRVHVVWLVGSPLLGLLAATGRDSFQAATAYLLLPLVWALSVLAHEAGHALMAARLGHRVESVSLLPMGGATVYDGPPARARDQMLISGAGPAVSALLALVPLLIGLAAAGSAADWWLELAAFNGAIYVWNALPALPLDGGRVVQAALRATGRDPLRASRGARSMGHATAYALGAMAGAALVLAPVDPVVAGTLALALYATGLMLLKFNGAQLPAAGLPSRPVGEHEVASR